MSDNTPQAVQACHELLLWLIPLLDRFPRSRRFTLGERLEARLLSVVERLVEAAYSRDKRTSLARANLDLEMVRHLWRLAFEPSKVGRVCGFIAQPPFEIAPIFPIRNIQRDPTPGDTAPSVFWTTI